LLGLTVGDHDRTAVSLRGDRQLVASQLAVEPKTLSRILSNLAHQGLIQVSGRNITIVSVARLRDAC
jgi:CRP-like cAMP-binding protein